MARRILIIEDNRDLRELLRLHLRDLGCEVRSAADGTQGLEKAESGRFDLIILDLMLPGVEGLEVCRQLRRQANYTPILMLTAKSDEVDRVVGLEVGADDYLTKPFNVRELLARVKAIFRRVELSGQAAETPAESLAAADMAIDLSKRQVTVRGQRIELTAKEFDLLTQFARHPGRVYTRAQLLDLVWGYGHAGYEHTVNSHINRLRAKIERDPAKPDYVLTVWGVGYKFNDRIEGAGP
ncbi:MAG: response regulator transcription factor [Alphaproteobacteria bacterium]|jgi:DNA-binding response OmpR family regulator|nr:response regulator transcription factor [Alphaproteobacteria bacterium]